MSPNTRPLFLLYSGWIFSLSIHAQESPCAADIAKFCANVSPGEQRVVKCLREHEAELSVLCRAASQAVKQQESQLTASCSADIFLYCGGVNPGGGRIMKCLKENETKLSPECRKLQRPESAAPSPTPAPKPPSAKVPKTSK